MPLNEAGGFRRSNLTKQQRREAELAIYGPVKENNVPMNAPQFTPEQIEQMRALLEQHDEATGRNKPRQFDLATPPREVSNPGAAGAYRHQEFPMMIYHHKQKLTKVVPNPKELKAHLDKGWKDEPFVVKSEEIGLDGQAAAEAALIDAALIKKSQE